MTAAVRTWSVRRGVLPGPVVLGRLILLAALPTAGVAVITAMRVRGITAGGLASPATALLVVAAGLAPIVVGVAQLRRPSRTGFGALLAAAGLGWLLAEWASPGVGLPIAFTIGVALGWLFPAVLLHAVAVHMPQRDLPERALITTGYLVFGGLLGLVPAVTFDAAATGCSLCPADVLAIAPWAAMSEASTALGSVLGAVWGALAATLLVVRLRRGPTPWTDRAIAIVGALLAAVVSAELAGRALGARPSDPTVLAVRLVAGGLLVAVSLVSAIEWSQARRSRHRVARLVLDMAPAADRGQLRDVLATTLGDPGLVIGYPLDDGRLVDAAGALIAPSVDGSDRRRTPLVRDGVTVAVLERRASHVAPPAAMDEVVRAARLGLEHERAEALTRAQLAELSAARRRIVETATDERRRLERDLHDGAQQRLLVVAVGLQLLAADTLPVDARRTIEAIRAEVNAAIDDLRTIARGLFPAILADEGIGAALEGLAESARVPVTLDGDLRDRFERIVEAAAYATAAELVDGAVHPVTIVSSRTDVTISLSIIADRPADGTVTIEDWVRAVGGSLRVTPVADDPWQRSAYEVDIPCAS